MSARVAIAVLTGLRGGSCWDSSVGRSSGVYLAPLFSRPSEPVGFSSLNLLGDRNVNFASVRLALRKAVDRLQGTWKTPAAAGAV
jgi:hypothetical protein